MQLLFAMAMQPWQRGWMGPHSDEVALHGWRQSIVTSCGSWAALWGQHAAVDFIEFTLVWLPLGQDAQWGVRPWCRQHTG
jgi:hypothetical protein